jgi:LPXTG-motif cell wall-anchored protein
MPARPCIAALAAVLALAAPAAALGQDEPGAGDSQYSDPFGPQPSQQQPAQTQTQPPAQPAQPQPTPDHEAGDQGQDAALAAQAEPAPAQPAPAQSQPARTLPRTGFDVLPLAAAGVALLLAGVALWRRPHARR